MAGLTAQLPHRTTALSTAGIMGLGLPGGGGGGLTHEPAVRTSELRLEEGSSLAIWCTTSKVTLHAGCMSDCGSVFVLCLC